MSEFEKAENSIKHILQEFEINLTEDTLENRMVLARVEEYSKKLSEVLQTARDEWEEIQTDRYENSGEYMDAMRDWYSKYIGATNVKEEIKEAK